MLTHSYNGYNLHLIESSQEMQTLFDEFNPKVLVGLDTETTGLDYNKDSVVGVCVSGGKGYSPGAYDGYYIPIAHSNYPNNIPTQLVVDFVNKLFESYKIFLFNRSFDFYMLERMGCNVPHPGQTHDVQIIAHLVTNESYPSLKDFVKRYLKWDVLEFSSTGSVDHNFGTTDPRSSYLYAAADPLNTVLLGRKLWADFPYVHKIYKIDNSASEAVRLFEKNSFLYLDNSMISAKDDELCAQLKSLEFEIYAIAGYRFKINSNRDKAEALSRFVTLTSKTSSGSFKVDSETLERIDHPLAKLLVKYAEVQKARSSYTEKMKSFPQSGWRAHYSTVNVATGRLSSGSQKGNSYFANINAQNLPKEEVMKFLQRTDYLGYEAKPYDAMLIGKDLVPDQESYEEGQLTDEGIQELYEISLEDGTKYHLSGECSVLCKRAGNLAWVQVMNLQPDDVIV